MVPAFGAVIGLIAAVALALVLHFTSPGGISFARLVLLFTAAPSLAAVGCGLLAARRDHAQAGAARSSGTATALRDHAGERS